LAVGLGLALAVFALFAWPIQKSYFENRYQDFELAERSGLTGPYRWAEGVTDSKIALAGTMAGFKQYGFWGPDLSNEVVYLGRNAPHGGFNAIGTCEEFADAVNAADPDYLVTAPYLNFDDYDLPENSPEFDWAMNDPAALKRISSHYFPQSFARLAVWKVEGPMDPALCSRLGPDEDFVPGRDQN
jgi:hypothetical protein